MPEIARNKDLERLAEGIVREVEKRISSQHEVSYPIPPEVLMKKFNI